MILTAVPPVEATIREGHRGLLTTFRELAHDLEGEGRRLPDAEVLRALVAFLRQSLIPFGHWEDRHPGGCPEVAEDDAFEHAFLAVEIDALAAAAAEIDRAGAAPDAVAARIRRHVHRVESVLELHVQKAEDRAGAAASPGAGPRDASGKGTRATRDMESAEIQQFLRRQEWGVLCTVGDGTPYAVPVSYGFDGRFLYVASGPGRKRRNLEANAAVCVTVSEVESGDRWSSVVATGEARPVTDLRGRLQALDAIRRQRKSGAPPSAADLARIAGASIFRITPTQLTGRTRG